MQEDQIRVGMRVRIEEVQKSAPFNGAIGTVVAITTYDNAPLYIVKLYDAQYRFRAYDLNKVE